MRLLCSWKPVIMTTFHPFEQLPDVILVKPTRHADARGYFEESYNKNRFWSGGVDCEFVQDNHSLSVRRGVLRGLHFQAPPHGQHKLVRCTRGSVLDVAVDIRSGSPTFGKYVAAELSAENGWQLFVPIGYAHGFCTLKENCEIQYKVSSYYSAESDGGIAFNDDAIGIDWPFPDNKLILSDKDKKLPKLDALSTPFDYNSLAATQE